MEFSWLGAIIVGAGCLALGYFVGASFRSPKDTALVSSGNKKKDNPKGPLEIENLADILDDFKMILVVRNDLKMGKGKIAAQCSHATLGLYKKLLHRAPKALNRWEMCAQPKVVVKIESEEDMLVLQERAKSLKLPTHITVDAGRTQIAPNSRTVMAILGPVEVVDDVTGRTFNIGKIKGVNVIYVVTGAKSVNAAISVQILVDKFQIRGIVHYGTAGSANYTLYLGDVGIPTHVAFTSSWSWKEIRSEKGENEELIFGDYDYPRKGDNLLGKVELTPQELISNSETNKEDHVFWLPIEPKWLTLATQLKNLKLQRCITLKDTYCLEESPKLVYDVRGSTADVLLHNKAYREFLSKHVNVSIVDQESAAVVAASLSNGVPCIVFRGVSDMAGGEEDPSLITSLLDLAATNALHVAVKFLVLLRDQTT